jgi:hypothetical protein
MKDMLGAVVRKIADLPLEMLGTICDLAEKMAGEAGQEWLAELKKFLRKEKSWVGGEAKEIFLQLISDGEDLAIDAADGSEILAEAREMFPGGIDSDFKNWGADERGLATAETPVEVYEMMKDATFSQMFGSLNADVRKNCLTQHQIKNFVRKHRNWIRTDGYATFFLFESYGHFFVARVHFHDVVRLFVFVYRFGRDDVWGADDRHRVVIPQVA